MRAGSLLLLALCGCDALFGIDHVPSPAAADAPIDTPSGRTLVMGQVTKRWLYEDASMGPTLETAQYATSPITVRLSDGSAAPLASWEPTGAFSFETAIGERYSVIVGGGLQVPGEFQLSTPVVSLDDLWMGHPDQVPSGAGAAIEWTTTVTTIPAAELRFATTGIWSSTIATATTVPGKYTVSWPTASFFGGQTPTALRASAHDWLYVLHYTTTTTASPNTRVLDQYSALGMVSTSASGATGFNSNLGALSRPYCVDAYWNHAQEIARLTQRYPQFASPGGETRVTGVALPDTGFRTSYELALVFGNATDSHYALQFGNPFGLTPVLLDNIFVIRMLSSPTVPISVNIQYYDALAPSMTCARHDNSPPPPLPYAPTLDGAPMVDNLVLASDGTKLIDLHWLLDPADIPNIVTQVALVKNNVVDRIYFTVDDHVFINPRDLQSGAQYRVQIAANRGQYTAAFAGDFVRRSYPFSLTLFMTGYFSISKP